MSTRSDLETQHSADVCKRAEELIRGRVADLHRPLPQEFEQLLYELEVHRTELQMQNDALREALVEMEASRDRDVDLYDLAPVGYVTLDAGSSIRQINRTAAGLLGTEQTRLMGHALADYVDKDHKQRFCSHLLECRTGSPPASCEVLLRPEVGPPVPVKLDTVCVEGDEDTLYRTVITDITERKQAEEEIRLLSGFPEQNPNPVLRIAHGGVILYANSASATLLTCWNARCGGPAPPGLSQRAAAVLASGEVEEMEFTCDGRVFSCVLAPVSDLGYVNVYGRDVTAPRRAERIVQARLRMLTAANIAPKSLDEVLQMVLDEIEFLTGSAISFYHFLEADQATLALQSWSSNTLRNMCTAEGKGTHYPVSQAGVWVDCVRQRRPVIHNDYASLPHRRGLPAGHAPVIRELVVPVLRAGRIVAIVGVGNKPTDYDETDVEIVSFLADFSWEMAERKRAEEALRRAKDDWEETFDTVPDFVAILDRQHRVVRANRAMAERLNLTPEQCIGLHCYEVVHGTSSPPKSCLHAQTCRDGREHTTELEEPRLGGHFLVTTSPRFDEQGRVIGTVHVARDITRLKRAEKALQRLNAELERRVAEQTAEVRKTYEAVKAERQRLYDLLETLPVYVVLLSKDYHVPFANRFFRERFGESHGRCCFEYLFQRKEPCENCETYKVLSTGAPHRWEWTGPDGRYYDVYDFPFVDTDGSTLILEMGIDITDRTKAQLALEASEARYRSFVTASTQIVWTRDAQGLVVGDMPSWRAFTGQSLEEIQGWGWLDALHPDDRQRTAAAWSQAVATQSLYATEHRVRRHDGEYRWLSARGVPVLADGVIREWVGACTDITERKRAEEEMQRMREELGHVDRAARLGELTASLAHELNQPLAAILSNAQAARRFLASAAPDLDMFREILDDIIRDDKRAGSVIHRLRLMLQKGKQEPETFSVNDAVREVVQLLNSEILGGNAALRMDLAPRLPPVQAGRVEVQQVMVNLLLNALDALKDVPPDRREIRIRTSQDKDAVVVAVRDRGCGIQSPDVNSVFEPFFTTKAVGLGMGLAICRRMIQAHGGRIWAANNEDAGATVSFSLPSTRSSPEPSDG